MKTNYELLKEVFEEGNLAIKNMGDCLSIVYNNEEVVKIFEENLEDFEEPIEILIDCFYQNNKRAKSKEYVKSLERDLNRTFKNTLKSDDNEEILSLVSECKEIKTEIDSFKEDLKWTKEVARSLYLAQELFLKKFEDEV